MNMHSTFYFSRYKYYIHILNIFELSTNYKTKTVNKLQTNKNRKKGEKKLTKNFFT